MKADANTRTHAKVTLSRRPELHTWAQVGEYGPAVTRICFRDSRRSYAVWPALHAIHNVNNIIGLCIDVRHAEQPRVCNGGVKSRGNQAELSSTRAPFFRSGCTISNPGPGRELVSHSRIATSVTRLAPDMSKDCRRHCALKAAIPRSPTPLAPAISRDVSPSVSVKYSWVEVVVVDGAIWCSLRCSCWVWCW